MRTTPPASFTKRLSPSETREVSRWWRGLAPPERRALGRDAGRPPAGIVIGRFVEPGARADSDGETTDFYEYLVNHEILLEDDRPHHICAAHAEARAALRAGLVPAAFRCPRANVQCPMRALLDGAPGCDSRLSLVRSDARSAAVRQERLR